MLADSHALSASHAFAVAYMCFFSCYFHGIVTAVFLADAAPDAVFEVDDRLGRRVELEFAPYAGRAHAQILERPAESCLLMPFEMVH